MCVCVSGCNGRKFISYTIKGKTMNRREYIESYSANNLLSSYDTFIRRRVARFVQNVLSTGSAIPIATF